MPSNKYTCKDKGQQSDPEEQGFKQLSFETLHCLLRANEGIPNLVYYLLMLV